MYILVCVVPHFSGDGSDMCCIQFIDHVYDKDGTCFVSDIFCSFMYKLLQMCVGCSVQPCSTYLCKNLLHYCLSRKHKIKLAFILPVDHLGFLTCANYILISFN